MADISLRPAAETKASPWRATGLTVVRVTLGVILLSASGLKLLSWGDDSGLGSSLALLYDPFWRMAAVEVEALLGLWLLVGLWPRALWWSALLWFLLLSGTSFYLGLVGQPSCGCFGEAARQPLVRLRAGCRGRGGARPLSADAGVAIRSGRYAANPADGRWRGCHPGRGGGRSDMGLRFPARSDSSLPGRVDHGRTAAG